MLGARDARKEEDSMDIQWVYPLNRYDQLLQRVEGNRDKVRRLLGDKGASLAEMREWGLPVPPAFTITTEASVTYWETGAQIPPKLWRQVAVALADIEHETGRRYGDPTHALLLSSRVGATGTRFGMVETVLNLGLNDRIAKGLVAECGDARFVYDLYRRLIYLFGTIVMGIPAAPFEAVLKAHQVHQNGASETTVTGEEWQSITSDFKTLIVKESGRLFPQDPYDQLHMAIEAAFRVGKGSSHEGNGAFYQGGTAVTVEAMVYGNRDGHSATGVVRTCHLKTGTPTLEGEYLVHAQGEAVERGATQTTPIADLALEMPHAWTELHHYCHQLERYYHAPQEVEFTIEAGKLWVLESRTV
jgi:pyruvate,orthophosphate dikinase